MRLTLLALATAITATPFLWAENAAVTTPISSISAIPTRNATRTRHHNHHKEPTPTFKLECNCQKPIIPVGQINPKELCEYNYFLNMACFHQAQGGCASPTLARRVGKGASQIA
ncbi:hypothetical protein BU23DRAFT_565658 [Bimuria novae-zelandiae CBS 107.79]|uniref:Uncharacterized protein n=1 Tax=Bimuria novae-zelandiae CBS 107.79 TaxID=1447943 RepID=A0A6A5VNF0_9PLEO|nr:hypothetical protein BU23DRAFT_565658 [Bimuria novae-zelandiae CBS 107.79]